MIILGGGNKLKPCKPRRLFALRLVARSLQISSVVMPCNVLVEKLAPVCLFDSAMHSELRLDVRKRALQRVVGVGYSQVWIVVCRPQVGHVAVQAQVCAPEWPVGEMSLP